MLLRLAFSLSYVEMLLAAYSLCLSSLPVQLPAQFCPSCFASPWRPVEQPLPASSIFLQLVTSCHSGFCELQKPQATGSYTTGQ